MNATNGANWSHLHADLYVRILICLPLNALCGLKAVSRATANMCRCLIRSEEWQDTNQNEFDLQTALSGSPQKIQFPFRVSILEDYFGRPGPEYHCNVRNGGRFLLATVHRLNVVSFDNDGERVPFHEASRMSADDIRHVIIDVCIEIDGYGILSSEQQLRSALQEIVLRRGARRFPMQKGKALAAQHGRISGLTLEHLPDGDWDITGDNFGDNVMLATYLLSEMNVVTEVARGKWLHHTTFLGGYSLSVFDLIRARMGPYS